MAASILCYVTDRKLLKLAAGISDSADILRRRIRAAAQAGVDWIQIREKDLEGSDLLDLAQAAVSDKSLAPEQASCRILINDRLDIALTTRSDGVHLGENSIPMRVLNEWRNRSGHAKFLIGTSCHSIDDAQRSQDQGADYVFFGPIFNTPSKERFGPPQGLRNLAEVCSAVKIPVLAIGGVTLEDARTCIQSGAAGIAAIRLFQESANLAEVIGRLRI